MPRGFRNYRALLRELEPILEGSTAEGSPIQSPEEQADDALLSKVDLPLRAVFYPLGFAFEIITNNVAVLNAASESWGHTKQREGGPILQLRIGVTKGTSEGCPPGPVVRSQQHLLSIVADAHNQAICDLNTGVSFAWVNEGALQYPSYLRYHFLEAVALTLISTSYATPIHAACVSRYGCGLLLCGDSGAGKSTLAYACARSGWTFTSDDASYLKHNSRELCMIGNSHQLRFRPSARELFPELQGRSLTPRAEGKPSIEVPTAELPGIVTAEEVQVRHVVLLNRWPSPYAELLSLPRKAARRYFQQYLPFSDRRQQEQSEALQRLYSADVYELRYQDLAQAVDCLDHLARTSGLAT